MELLVSDNHLDSGSRWLLFHAVAVFAFLYLPIAILILYSFNGEGVGGFPPHHLTLDWYRTLFADGPIWDSVLNSLQVAFAAMAISLTLRRTGRAGAGAGAVSGESVVPAIGAAAADPAGHYYRTFAADVI